MKFPKPNYTLLYFILIALGGIGLPISASAVPVPNTEALEIDEMIGNRSTGYSDPSNLIPRSTGSGELSLTAQYFFVQDQPGSLVPEAELEGNSVQPNSTDKAQISTEDEVSANSESINGPSTGSTNRGNLTPRPTTIKCEGSALCVTGEVVKVINGKTFYVDIKNKVYKVELSLIGLPFQSEQAMRAATIFTRNSCLGSNVLIDQDDGQKVDAFVAQVYCSPTMNLNSLLLQTGYVQLDKSQCQTSEFSKLDWAKFYGC